MLRVITSWALAGLLIPIMILIIDHFYGVFPWPHLVLALWPSWIFNAVTFGRESTVFGISVLILSIAVNIVLYAGFGFFLSWLFSKYLRYG